MCDPLGLFIYIFLLITVFLAVLVIRKNSYFSLALLLFVSFISVFRASAGIDTPLYIARFDRISDTDINYFFEPVIPLLMRFINSLGLGFNFFSLVYGTTISFLYWFLLKKYPNFKYFGITIFPVIFIDSLYNGVRIGLAYPIILYSIVLSSITFAILASSVHISSLISLPFLRVSKKYIFITLVTIIFIYTQVGFDISFIPYRYLNKFEVYSDLEVQNPYGGISDSIALYISTLILIRALNYKNQKFLILAFLLFIFILTFHILIIAEYKFMLRVLRLFIFIVFGFILKLNQINSPTLFKFSFVFGFLYTLNFVRQIVSTCSYENGFLPLID